MKTGIEKVLTGLGFTERDFGRMTDEFSGGWQMRIALPKLLLQQPNILLLDEPTNHLDLEAIEALEESLAMYTGTLLLITHDRTFLERLKVDTTYLLDETGLRPVKSYASYEKELRPNVERLLRRLEERRGRFL